MSPEQVRGKSVDHRSDIFSLGTTLYEMLTGRRAFQGESAVETLNAVLNSDPPEFGAEIPPALESIVRHCMEKGVDERFQSAWDLAFALEAISGHSTAAQLETTPPTYRSVARTVAVLLPVSFIAGALVTYFSVRQTSPQPRQLVNALFAQVTNEPG